MTRHDHSPSPFKFKDWLTLKDAARSISTALDDDFREADVLRLALDDSLRLSVDFVNRTYGHIGRVHPVADFTIVAADLDEPLPRRVVLWRTNESVYGAQLTERDVVRLDSEITIVHGLWDLPLIGCERLDVLHEYHRLTAGPAVRHAGGPSLTLVNRADGLWAQLLMPMCDRPSANTLDAATLSLKRPLLDFTSTDEIQDAETLGEIPQCQWSLAPGLPADCVFVVRTAALTQFIASERSHSETRRPVGLTHIAANQRVGQAAIKATRGVQDGHSGPSEWKDLMVRFLTDERVQLYIRGQPGETLSYTEFGFQDRRSGKRALAWSTFLLLAKHGGVLGPGDLSRPAGRPRIQKHVQQIRKVLGARFPHLDADPLPWRGDHYQAQFAVERG